MQKSISSAQTFYMKLVFPTIWISLFGSGAVLIMAGVPLGAEPAVPLHMKVLFPLMWVVGAASFLWMCAPLKRVRLEEGNLLISNYFKEIQVPLTLVSDVTENRWLNIHPVTIHFKRSTGFGDKITFMPKIRLFGFFSSHPIVFELRRMAGLRAA